MQQVEDKLRGFRKFGVILTPSGSGQAIGNCCFCGKDKKLYVNENTQLWDCKVCGRKGNYQGFLYQINEEASRKITEDDIMKLAQNRGLPAAAFRNWKLGKWGNDYILPIWDINGKLQDLRTYQLGKKFMSAPGQGVGLLNIENLEITEKEEIVYLCEGEWDGIALQWLLRRVGKPGTVVAVPGANTFKKEWIPSFQDKHVVCLYDNDPAGESGEITVLQRLTGCAKTLRFIHWPTSLPAGFDIRDLVAEKAVRDEKPRGCFAMLDKFLKDTPRKPIVGEVVKPTGEKQVQHLKPIDRTVTLQKVFDTFGKWMHQPNHDAIELVVSTVISNELQGDPLWLFLVAPPGGSKTEILMTFEKCPTVYSTSSLTPHSLISGTNFKNGKDMSLIPELDGMNLFVKDFTSILGKREVEKDEIFGILRDAYDGKCGKKFGTGVHRYYNSHFSIVAGVTTTIYELSSQYSGLGERFLKFFIGDNLVHQGEKNVIRRAMRNVNKETDMRDEMAYVVRSYVELLREKMKQPGFKIPTISPEAEDQIIALAQFIARMRAIVIRDKYNADMILSKPSAEVGSRLGKQLTKAAISIAITNSQEQVGEHELRILRKIALDTISQRNEGVLRTLYVNCQTEEDALTTKEISFKARYPFSTISRLLGDMDVLDIVKKGGINSKHTWSVSDYILTLIKESKLYQTPEEINRPVRKEENVRTDKSEKSGGSYSGVPLQRKAQVALGKKELATGVRN